MPMAMAPAGYLLYTRFLRHDPADPAWPDRDRFVLAAGHGSMLLYSLLYGTARECARRGANVLVAGTAVFDRPSPARAYRELVAAAGAS